MCHNWLWQYFAEREKLLSIKKLSKIAERFLNIGYESTASAATLTLYEILQAPSIYKKIIEEIRQLSVATKNANNADNKLTYGDIDSLQYLGACIKGTYVHY